MRVHLSGSSLWRAAICAGSAVLPRAGEVNAFSERGIGFHAFLLDVNRLGRDEALAAIKDDELRAACELVNVARLPVDPGAYAAEVAFAYDVASGKSRELHRDGKRDYRDIAPTEIPCTLDVVALVGADAVYIGDYKTGFKYLPPPATNWQFRFGALAAARCYGRRRAIVEMLRIGKDGEPYKVGGELDLFDLAEVAEDVRDLHARATAAADDADPPLRVGAHCAGCESISFCKAQTALVRACVTAPEAQIVGVAELERLTEEQVLDALDQVDAIEKLGSKLRELVQAYATHHPIRRRDGTIYAPLDLERTSPEGAAVWHFLCEWLGEVKAWEAVKISSTWEKIEAVARDVAKTDGRKTSHVMREFRAELANRGAVKVRTYVSYGPHSPAKWKKAAGELGDGKDQR